MKIKQDPEKYSEASANCACSNLRMASRAITKLYDEMLHSSGLRSTQLSILLEIAAAQSTTVPSIARRLVMDISTVTRNLKPLERRGLIKNSTVKYQRSIGISLTPEGYQLIDIALPICEQAQNSFVAEVGRKRWLSLIRSLSDVINITQSSKL